MQSMNMVHGGNLAFCIATNSGQYQYSGNDVACGTLIRVHGNIYFGP